ncbi:MAG TPA: phenylalanine--tRNA ligase subunit beta [Ktedonobacterales bacterium]|jgi:phenylalanyl-tRNA synthetase beta chain
MKIPYTWLQAYVDVTLSPAELADHLTMAGLEVDRVEYPWPGIVTAEIVHLERIKGSDHLSATRISTGSGPELSVVCGASNIHLHDRVPLAQLGAKVGALTIQTKRTMGVVSEGMLCSPRELGLSDDHAGILILPPDTPLGVPLGQVLGGAVIDLDIKAHRGDLFCMVGVAREVAAFTGRPLRPPSITLQEKGAAAGKLMKLTVEDAALCPRYTARVVRNVRMGASPVWLRDRLTAAGMRPINNVVDITNYVMLELGQPLHAFDYHRVAGHHIVVRRARAGETITTLDGVTRDLTPEMLLITDPEGPLVIAGIFGGERAEVSDTTTDVILEAAHFHPTSIRRASAALALRTESSGRFEKNPDVGLTTAAVDRAAQLIAELAGGQAAPGRLDAYPEPATRRVISFDTDQVEWLVGLRATPAEAAGALSALGFVVETEPGAERRLAVTVPTWRGDVEESADLVEEVARILGYDRIPATIPAGPLPEPPHVSWFERENALRDVLAGAGLTEIITYTLINRVSMARLLLDAAPEGERLLTAPALVPELGSGDTANPGKAGASVGAETALARGREEDQRLVEATAARLPAITLHNPLSAEMDVLRLTLMAGLLNVLRANEKHGEAGLWFYELGRRYLPTLALAAGTGLAEERRTLGVALMGPLAHAWDAADRAADFYDLKGVAERVLGALAIGAYRYVPVRHPTFHPGRAAALEIAMPMPEGTGAEGTSGDGAAASSSAVAAPPAWLRAGVLGEVHPQVAARWDLTGRPYLMELDLERLYAAIPERPRYRPVSRFPAVRRDLAVVVDRAVAEDAVAAAIRAAGGPLLRRLDLFDVYTGEAIAADKKSLAYALAYQAPDRTLTDAEVDAAQRGIVDALARAFGATLRA